MRHSVTSVFAEVGWEGAGAAPLVSRPPLCGPCKESVFRSPAQRWQLPAGEPCHSVLSRSRAPLSPARPRGRAREGRSERLAGLRDPGAQGPFNRDHTAQKRSRRPTRGLDRRTLALRLATPTAL